MSGVEEKTEALVLLLSGVSDRKLRAVSLEGKLSGMGMEEIASILNHISQRAKFRELPYLKAYHALPELLRSPNFTREAILELRAVARQRDYVEVFRMLLELPPKSFLPLIPTVRKTPF